MPVWGLFSYVVQEILRYNFSSSMVPQNVIKMTLVKLKLPYIEGAASFLVCFLLNGPNELYYI